MSHRSILPTTAVLLALLQTGAAVAQAPAETAQVIDYDSTYFSRYRPDTALDMVRQLPAFQLDDGGENRGLATSAGNILINGRRPSAKNDLPSATLSRIPAGQVERIELIRGQTGGIDLQGQSILANVILRSEIPATVRWQFWAQHNNAAPEKAGGNVSWSDRLGTVDYNAGIDMERDTSGWYGTEYHYNGNRQLTGSGPDNSTEKGFRINSINFNASSWMGQNFIQVNTKLNRTRSDYFRPTRTTPVDSLLPVEDVIINTANTQFQYELGADVERALGSALTGKGIVLLTRSDQDSVSSREDVSSLAGQTLFRLADTGTVATEQVLRLELNWAGMRSHDWRLNLERARNVLDRDLVQTDDRGSGAVSVTVPGANSRVREIRWDLLLQDTWSWNDLKVDLGLGAERSTLGQTGDAELMRNFFFLKPHLLLTHAPGRDRQTRLRLAREVTQLDLTDFVSATVFEDDDLALGNPNIRPEATWIAEFTHERRFGPAMVASVTVFHHWIEDVLDLLPLGDEFEAPGNIGDGRRWGVQLEGSAPLDRLGLANARLDLRAVLQDSTVLDPVTGDRRRLSGEGGQGGYRTLGIRNLNMTRHLRADFRQDFTTARFAWGWTIADRGIRPLYKVNEYEVNSEGVAVDAFIETTRWAGVKLRLVTENFLNFTRERDRFLYSGARDLSPLDGIIESDRHTGRRFTLYVNGDF